MHENNPTVIVLYQPAAWNEDGAYFWTFHSVFLSEDTMQLAAWQLFAPGTDYYYALTPLDRIAGLPYEIYAQTELPSYIYVGMTPLATQGPFERGK